MYAIESNEVILKIQELYPAWNPTATLLEAIRHKLRSFDLADTKAAVLETYEPGRRTAPLDAIFAECRTTAARRRRSENSRPEVGPLCTKEEADAIWAKRAAEGDTLAKMWCNKHNIPYEAKEAIPF